MAGAAHAITPVLVDVQQQGSVFEFTYEATLAPDQGVRTGDRLVIFDFSGFTGFGLIPNPGINAFTENTTAVSNDPDELQPVPGFFDDPNLPNLVFRWDAPPLFTVGEHPSFDFMLSAFSTFSATTFDGFTSITVTNNGPNFGQPIYTQGSTTVPMVPEPASWAMMILGFGGVGAVLRRRRAFVAFA